MTENLTDYTLEYQLKEIADRNEKLLNKQSLATLLRNSGGHYK
jgi:hypothetical protein